MKLRTALTSTAAVLALTAGASVASAGDYYVSVFGGVATNGDEPRFNASQTGGPRFVAGFSQLADNTTAALGVPVGTVPVPIAPSVTIAVSAYADVYLDLYKLTYMSNGASYFGWNDDFENGFVIGGAFGQDFGGWRAEAELAYRSFDIDGGANARRRYNADVNIYFYGNYVTYVRLSSIATGKTVASYTTKSFSGTVPVGPSTSLVFPATLSPGKYSTVAVNATTDGSIDAWSLMANIWIDFDPIGIFPDNITPFIGGGVGAALVDFEYDAAASTFLGSTLSGHVEGDSWAMAYQLGAGINFDLGNGMLLSAQYRYFGTSDADIGSNVDTKIEGHNAIVSLSVPLAAMQ